MGLPKYNAKRDHNEAEIINAYKTLGCSVHTISQEGVPDLLVGRQGITCVVEVKSESGSYTPAQREFNQDFKGYRKTVRTIDDAVAHVNEMTMIKMALGG